MLQMVTNVLNHEMFTDLQVHFTRYIDVQFEYPLSNVSERLIVLDIKENSRGLKISPKLTTKSRKSELKS